MIISDNYLLTRTKTKKLSLYVIQGCRLRCGVHVPKWTPATDTHELHTHTLSLSGISVRGNLYHEI